MSGSEAGMVIGWLVGIGVLLFSLFVVVVVGVVWLLASIFWGGEQW